MKPRNRLQKCFLSGFRCFSRGRASVGNEAQETDSTEQADQEVILGEQLADGNFAVAPDPGESQADQSDRDKNNTLKTLCSLTAGP